MVAGILLFYFLSLIYVVLTGIAIRVAIGAARQRTRTRYAPALMCGLIAYALSAPFWALIYTFAGFHWFMQALSNTPSSLAGSVLPGFATGLRACLSSTLHVGLYVGLFAAIYLVWKKRFGSRKSGL